jgi:hypothetical protein
MMRNPRAPTRQKTSVIHVAPSGVTSSTLHNTTHSSVQILPVARGRSARWIPVHKKKREASHAGRQRGLPVLGGEPEVAPVGVAREGRLGPGAQREPLGEELVVERPLKGRPHRQRRADRRRAEVGEALGGAGGRRRARAGARRRGGRRRRRRLPLLLGLGSAPCGLRLGRRRLLAGAVLFDGRVALAAVFALAVSLGGAALLLPRGALQLQGAVRGLLRDLPLNYGLLRRLHLALLHLLLPWGDAGAAALLPAAAPVGDRQGRALGAHRRVGARLRLEIGIDTTQPKRRRLVGLRGRARLAARLGLGIAVGARFGRVPGRRAAAARQPAPLRRGGRRRGGVGALGALGGQPAPPRRRVLQDLRLGAPAEGGLQRAVLGAHGLARCDFVAVESLRLAVGALLLEGVHERAVDHVALHEREREKEEREQHERSNGAAEGGRLVRVATRWRAVQGPARGGAELIAPAPRPVHCRSLANGG